MNWGFIAVGGVLVLLGLVCLWFRHKFREEVAVMAATPTSRAADVKTLAPGSVVEVKGTIRCAAPLTGEFSKRPCVYVRSVVERKETRWRDGKRETFYTNERTTELHAPFEVEDDSGRVPVRGQGASVEAVEVFNESGNTGVDTAVSVVLTVTGAGSHERRFKESILAPDIPVYVLGSVVEGGAIGAPPHGAKIKEFIITHKTEEERARSSTTTATILLVVGCVLFAGAVASLVAAFVYRVN